MRKAFEEWVSGPPFEYSIERYPEDARKYSWHGCYWDHKVQLAWEAWQEAARQYQSISQPHPKSKE